MRNHEKSYEIIAMKIMRDYYYNCRGWGVGEGEREERDREWVKASLSAFDLALFISYTKFWSWRILDFNSRIHYCRSMVVDPKASTTSSSSFESGNYLHKVGFTFWYISIFPWLTVINLLSGLTVINLLSFSILIDGSLYNRWM